jgi:hypothetical protein
MNTDRPDEPLIIDRYAPNEKGETWYHLGNMYWSSEYKQFYTWLNPNWVVSEEDFPHDYFRFKTGIYEEEFLYKWGHRVVNDYEVVK